VVFLMPRSDDTKTNMAARLRALAAGIEEGPGVGPEMVKMIFDLKGAASHLDDLDELLNLLAPPVTLGDLREIGEKADEIRERKSKGSDPEPKMAP
jgi:hypothetical protein